MKIQRCSRNDYHFIGFPRVEAAKLGAGYFRKPPNYEEFLKIGAALKKVLKDNGLL